MEEFWKVSAAVLLAAILGLVLDRQGKDFSTLLTTAVCVMTGVVAARYLEPVLDLMGQLEATGGLQGEFLDVLMKAAGIGVCGELIGLICTDAGKASLARALQLVGSAVILSLSVPVFKTLIMMIQQMMRGL